MEEGERGRSGRRDWASFAYVSSSFKNKAAQKKRSSTERAEADNAGCSGGQEAGQRQPDSASQSHRALMLSHLRSINRPRSEKGEK